MRRAALLDTEHYLGGLHEYRCRCPDGKIESLDRFLCDGRRHDLFTSIEAHFHHRRHAADLGFGDLAGE